MKRKLTLIMVLFSTICTCMAQNQVGEKDFTMVEQREELHPEIVKDNWTWFEHLQHPATDTICVFWGGVAHLNSIPNIFGMWMKISSLREEILQIPI